MELKPGDYAVMRWRDIWYYAKILDVHGIYYRITWHPFTLRSESWPVNNEWIKHCSAEPNVKPFYCNQYS